MHGAVTGSLTRWIGPANSLSSPAVHTLFVRVRWDRLESDAVLHPHELVPYTELANNTRQLKLGN